MDKSKVGSDYENDLLTLIKMVEERPCLWDKTTVNKEPGQRKKAWKEISRHFAPNYDEMEEEEKAKLELNIQTKWKNLRDQFVKSMRMNTTSKYKYYESLKFLSKILKKPQVQAVVSKRGRPLKPIMKKLVHSAYRANVARARRRLAGAPRISTCRQTEPDVKCSVSETNVTFEPQKNGFIDEDEAFFMSIMPTIKKFSDEDKLEFRLGVLTTIREINDGSKMGRNSSSSAVSNSMCSGLLFVAEDNFHMKEDVDVCN